MVGLDIKNIYNIYIIEATTFILLKLTLLQAGGADHPGAELSRDCHCGGEHPGHPQRAHPQPLKILSNYYVVSLAVADLTVSDSYS